MKLTIATCQFPIAPDIHANLHYILDQMREARRRRADVAHFAETALSGYCGAEFKTFRGFDWDLLESSTRQVMDLARRLKMWVVLGSSHRLSGSHKPHNSLYVIDDRGRIADRYDKCFCTGPRSARSGDLKHYSPGDHLVSVRIRGVTCGLLICHDFRYDELYREYRRRGVQVVFHSFHNARLKPRTVARAGNIWGVIVPPTLQAYAANNFMWISANNSTARVSCWPSFYVRPDGVIPGRLPAHRAGMLVWTVDTRAKLYDASADWRERAMKGVLHSGTTVKDPRSECRTGL